MTKVSKQKPERKLAVIIALVIFFLLLVYFGLSFFIADTLTTSKPNPTYNTPTFVAGNAQDVTFPTADGLKLNGWFFKNTTSKSNQRIIIEVAGMGQNRSDDNYYGLFIDHDLYLHGYSILVFDPRESGTPAARKDFGQTRGNDVLGAVQFAEQNGYAPKNIGIISNSLGTVSTLMEIEKLKNVGPIVIDSGISRMKPLLELRMRKDYNIPSFLFPGIFSMLKAFYHQDINNLNPVEHVTKVPGRRFLFLVGAMDDYIPPENSEALLEAANPASRLVIFPKAGHVQTYRSDPALYLKTIYTFFNQQFGEQ